MQFLVKQKDLLEIMWLYTVEAESAEEAEEIVECGEQEELSDGYEIGDTHQTLSIKAAPLG